MIGLREGEEEMDPVLVVVGLLVVGGLFVIFVGLAVIAKFYRKVDQGRALIVNTMKAEPWVTFTGKVVYPVIHRAEVMDISVKTIEIDRRDWKWIAKVNRVFGRDSTN